MNETLFIFAFDIDTLLLAADKTTTLITRKQTDYIT